MSLLDISNFAAFADGLDHPEGVAWGLDGNVYAGGEAGQVYRVTLDGKVTSIGSTRGFGLGLALDADLNIYMCDLVNGAIMKITQSGQVTQYTDNSEPITAPNYPVFDARGNLYFSSSGGFDLGTGLIYRATPGGKTEIVSREFKAFPNGMALSPDSKYLYVVLSNKPGVERAAIQPDGTLGKPEHIVTLSRNIPDGVAFDVEGNLYITCYTPDMIWRLTPSGALDVVAEDWTSVVFSSPTNIAFGGADMKTLIVGSLARWHLTKGQMPIAGQPVHYPKVK